VRTQEYLNFEKKCHENYGNFKIAYLGPQFGFRACWGFSAGGDKIPNMLLAAPPNQIV
jgi:hypothetical protein